MVLIIRTTPRTGSNLLMHSLDLHPEIISAGELYNTMKERCHPIHWYNKHNKKWNLAKTFYSEPLPFPCKTLFLYREDLEAQYTSYLKACNTGEWLKGSKLPPTTPDKEFVNKVRDAYVNIKPTCDLAISYEQLVDNWDTHINTILTLMNLTVMPIKQVLEKQ